MHYGQMARPMTSSVQDPAFAYGKQGSLIMNGQNANARDDGGGSLAANYEAARQEMIN